MNPVTTFFLLILYCILLFLFQDVFIIGALCFLSLALFSVTMGFSEIRRRKMILTFSFFIFLVNMIFLEGAVIDRLAFSLRMVFRFLGIIFSGVLFSQNDPNEFAYSLMKLGIPYRYAFTLVFTFRLVPLFDFESNIIKKAQTARGVHLDGIRGIPNFIRYTFFPLLHSALERVDSFTQSMEGRCFGLYPTRTFYREITFGKGDYLAAAAMIGILGASVYWRYL
jgi:energy-coupling factor transport system permease protein